MADSAFPDMLPGLNLKKGLQLMGGNKESYLKLLLKFSKNHTDVIHEIKKCLEEKNSARAQEIAHPFKGIAGSIGAEDLYLSTCDLEMAIKEEKTGEWSGKINLMEKCFAQVCSSIESLAGNPGSGDEARYREPGMAVDMDLAWPLVMELKAALEGFFADSIHILESLENACSGAGAMPELDDIKRLLESYDFNNALEALEKMIARLRRAEP